MSLAKKLQLKEGRLRVINAPAGIDLGDVAAGADGEGVLVFVTDRAELQARGAEAIIAAQADALSWVAYPKAGKLDTDLNRDSLWDALRGQGVRPVRQIAIDETWSALRFRPE